jgi:type III secretory pathway component EscT
MFVIFLPQLLLSVSGPLQFNLLLVLYVVKELFVGFSIGFMISIPFIIVQSTGIVIDHQRGGASLMVNDPTIQNQSSPIGTLMNMIMIVIFYLLDGPFLFIDVVHKSYELIPMDKFFNPEFFTINSFWDLQMQLMAQVVRVSTRFAAPALIAMLMTDMFLGIANRLAPQVQITFLGISLKSLIGLAVFCLGWNLLAGEMGKEMYTSINQVEEMVKLMRNPTPPPPKPLPQPAPNLPQ